jgi:hypothetical protein
VNHNQKIKVKPDHKFHPSREGFFQFMGGKEKDCVVCSSEPIPSGKVSTSWFVVGVEDIEE